MTQDSDYMQMALRLARRGLGSTWPNPSVGCVIVSKTGHIVGRGHTGQGGRPHGETVALKQAGQDAEGSTAYITLEPCAHHGQTPPCAQSLIEAGIDRAVVAITDPDSRVAGKGIEMLTQAGIKVDLGICQDETQTVNQGFFNRITRHRPLVTVKIASSQDGKIAGGKGSSQWVTGPESRARGHLLRADHDAIMVGIGTVLADNPSLDCRLPGIEDRSPIRIILDSVLSLPLGCKLVETARKIPTWVMTTVKDGDKFEGLCDQGVKVMTCKADKQGRIDMADMMAILANEGITRLLSEGGAQVNASLIRASLIDRLYWFRAPEIIGQDGLAALADMDIETVLKTEKFSLVREGSVGNDIWQEYMI